MSKIGARSWLKRLFFRDQPRTFKRRPNRLLLEQLEARETPATHIWTGGGGLANNSWTNPANWSGGVPTGVQDDLVFPANATQRNTLNNLTVPGGLAAFKSITVSGSDYLLAGNQISLGDPLAFSSNSLNIGAGAVNVEIRFDIQLGGPASGKQFFTVNAGADVQLTGVLSSVTTPELSKAGDGTLILTRDNSEFQGPISLANSGGIVRITHARALGNSAMGTTVGANATLQVSNITTGSINEPLILNGPGIASSGALLNVAGSTVWTGNIQLDSDVTLGADAGILTIQSQISDLGAGHDLIKEGTGTIVFAQANTYRGLTTINNGILTIQNANSLGTAGTPQNGTIVNDTVTKTATLQIDALGAGIVVLDELLTLNGTGVTVGANFIGALANARGNNNWAGDIILGSPNPNGSNVVVGISPNSSLIVSGVVRDVDPASGSGPFSLTKIGAGRLIFNNRNTYTGLTTIAAGALNIRDSLALGPVGSASTTVNAGAALELEVDFNGPQPTWPLEPHGRDLTIDSVTGTNGNGPQQGLTINEFLTINSDGLNGTGALRSISGINQWIGGINLVGALAAIGVDADPNSSTDNSYYTDDYSLRVTTNVITGGANTEFHKVQPGHLILDAPHPYMGETFIDNGWITIEDDRALGARIAGLGDTVQPGTFVGNGAALHLRPAANGNFNLLENLVLSGNGINHNFAFIHNKGALMNLSGNNVIGSRILGGITHGSDIGLIGNTGIGVERPFGGVSELTLVGSISNFVPPVQNISFTTSGSAAEQAFVIDTGSTSGQINISYDMSVIADNLRVYYPPRSAGGSLILDTGPVTGVGMVSVNYGVGASTLVEIVMNEGGATSGTVIWTLNNVTIIPNPLGGVGGITKLGSQRLILQGDGSYSGDVNIREGTLRAQHDTALGLRSSGTFTSSQVYTVTDTTVQSGASLELAGGIAANNGGISAGIHVHSERLVLNSPAVQIAVAGSVPLGGMFNVTYNGGTTADLPINVPASGGVGPTASLENALNALLSINGVGGSVTVTRTDNVYTILFGGTLAAVDNTSLTSALALGVAQVQVSGAHVPLLNLSEDNLWRGPTTLSDNTVIDVTQNSRLNLFDRINDTRPVSLTKIGAGELILAGDSTYRGETVIREGVVTLMNGRALGDTSGGTTVQNGASLQLQGAITIAGEQLTLEGVGLGTPPTHVPVRWFNAGPGPINADPAPVAQEETPGNLPVTGRVTGVAVDPTDSNVIYISSAGGGAWKTKDGGRTWQPLFDNVPETQTVVVTGATGTFNLTYDDGVNPALTTINLPVTAVAADLEAALNALLVSVGDGRGVATVTRTGSVFTITFGGTLVGMNLNQLTPGFAGGALANVNTLQNGVPQIVAMFSGAITIHPDDPRILYLGTGENNNTEDSFYGTGVYQSLDSGRTWTLLVDTTAVNQNPLFGLGIGEIVVESEERHTGTALNFGGRTHTRAQDRIYVAGSSQTSNAPAGTVPGVYRWDPTAATNRWFNLTAVVSAFRLTIAPPPRTPGPDDYFNMVFPQGSNFTPVPGTVGTVGPANWTDLAITYVDDTRIPGLDLIPVLYASLGNGSGNVGNTSGINSNSVFRCENPTTVSPVWYAGDPGATQNQVQHVVVRDSAITAQGPAGSPGSEGGAYVLVFNGFRAPPNPVTFRANAAASFISANLNGLPTISGVGGTITISNYTVNPGVIEYDITFGGSLGNSPQALITADNPAPSPGTTVTTTITTPGGGANTQNGGIPGAGTNRNGNVKFAATVTPNVAFPALQNTTLYAVLAQPSTPGNLGNKPFLPEVFRSQNGSFTWSAITSPPNQNFLGATPNGRGDYDLTVAGDPRNQGYLFIGGVGSPYTSGPWVTTNGGGAWTDVGLATLAPHSAYHASFVDVSNGSVIVGTDGGVYRLDAANNWTNLNGTLAITQFNSVSPHPNDPHIALGGTQGQGSSLFDGSIDWLRADGGTGGLRGPQARDAGQVHFDPKNPNIAYRVRIDNRISILQKSLDGGNTWTTLNNHPTFAPGFPQSGLIPFIIDTVDPARLLTGGANLHESLNGGNSWVSLTPNVGGLVLTQVRVIGNATYQGRFVADAGFSQVADKGSNTYDLDTIYAYGSNNVGGNSLLVTKDHGQSWQNRSFAFPGAILDLAVDAGNRDTVYAVVGNFNGTGRYVFRTTTAGVDPDGAGPLLAWDNITGNFGLATSLPNIPVNKIVVDPRHDPDRSGTVYVGTDNGVFVLPSAPLSPLPATFVWQRVGDGLPNVQVHDLVLNQSLNMLTAGTYGRSMYQFFLADIPPAVDTLIPGIPPPPVYGALRAVSGSSFWAGPIRLAGDTVIAAAGSQALQNGIAAAELNIVGTISDLNFGDNFRLTKIGQGDVILSGANVYGGVTEVHQGVLIVQNPQALGSSVGETIVRPGTALELQSDLEEETVQLFGNGIAFNEHFTGALRNSANNNLFTGTVVLMTHSTIGVDSGLQLTFGSRNGFDGTIDDGGLNLTLTKELTGTLALANANTYGGTTFINQGAIQVEHALALGGTTNGTLVRNGAQLKVRTPTTGPLANQNVVVAGETLSLTGTGISGSGAILNTGGDNTWAGPLTLDINPELAPDRAPPGIVAFGSQLGTLTIGTTITESLPTGISKVGPGTVVFNQANAYTGTTYVNDGILNIQHIGALGSTATPEIQRVTVTAPATGAPTFTLTYQGQTTGNLALGLPATGGAGPTGSVQNALEALSNIAPGDVSVTGPVGLTTPTGTRIFVYTITFGGTLTADQPPMVGAASTASTSVVVSTVADGLIGTVVNSALPVSAGTLQVQGGLAFPERLALNGNGAGGIGALHNFLGNNIWTGSVTLQSNTSIGAEANTQLTITGMIQDPTLTPPFYPVPAGSLTKVGAGALVFPNANSYDGRTIVDAGVLNIRNAGALGTGGPETQTITYFGASGTFRLSFGLQQTVDLVLDAAASVVQSALEALTNIGAGNVTVTKAAANVYTITFTGAVGALARTNVAQLTATGSGVTLFIVTTKDGPEGTVVNNGGTLQVQGGITVTSEALTLNGLGFNGQGALANAAGDNTWNNTIVLGAVSPAGIGSNIAGNMLTISQPITDGLFTRGVTKVGPGTLEYTGTADKTYQGTTTVNEGVLLLNMGTGFNPFQGPLTIGDNLPNVPPVPADTAVVRLAPGNPNQIPNGTATTVRADGLLDLNGNNETINNVSVLEGHVVTGGGIFNATTLTNNDGDIDVGSGQLIVASALNITNGRVTTTSGDITVLNLNMTGGTITLGGALSQLILTGLVTAMTSDLPQTPLITGPGAIDLGTGHRTFDVNENPAAPGVSGLVVESAIVGGAGGGVIKDGNGIMEIDSVANNYTETTEILEGVLQVDGAIGDVLLRGGTLGGIGNVGIVSSHALLGGVINPGDSGTGILHAGDTTLNNRTTFIVDLNDNINPGTDYDVLEVAGTINLNNATLAGFLGAGVGLGDSFTIITATSVVNRFAQGDVAFLSGKKFNVVYNSDSVVLTRVKTQVSIDVVSSVIGSVWGQDVTFTAIITPETGAGPVPSVPVSFVLTGPGIPAMSPLTYSENVANNMATFNPFATNSFVLDVTTPGNLYNVTATFPTTIDFDTVNDFVTQAVNKANTTINLSTSLNPAPVGVDVTITANVGILSPGGALPTSSIRTGTVTFIVDGIPQTPRTVSGGGVATITLTGLAVGGHLVSATYSGDSHFTGSITNADINQEVGRANTTTVVSSVSPSPSNPNQPVTFTVQVTAATGVPTGTVIFLDGAVEFGSDTLDGSGFASFDVAGLPSGVHTINFQYLGDTNYRPSSASTSHTIRGTTNMTVNASPNPSSLNQNVSITVSLVGNAPFAGTVPTSDVELYDGATFLEVQTLVNGSATFSISGLSFGAHTLNVHYVGDGNFIANDGSTLQTVKGAVNVGLSSAPNPSSIGQNVTFSVTVAAASPATGTPTGTVQFFEGVNLLATRTLASGSASFNIASLSIGLHTIRADYLGDTLFNINSGTTDQTVKGNSQTTVAAVPNPSTVGQQVTFTATVTPLAPASGTPTGSVDFFDGVNFIGNGMLTNGVATLDYSGLGAGAHTILAVYNGAPFFNTSSGTLSSSLVVNKANTSTSILSTTADPTIYGQPIVFRATVTAMAPGGGIPGGTVDFLDGAVVIGDDIPLVNGIADVSIVNLGAGTHSNITARFNGTADYNTSNSNPLLRSVNKSNTSTTLGSAFNPSVFGQTQFTATVTPSAPGGGVPDGTVNFTITNLTTTAFTITQAPVIAGVATLNPALLVGSYSVTAVYNGSPNYNGSAAGNTINPQVVAKANTGVTLATTASPAPYGAAVVTATVAPTVASTIVPSGQVIFHVTGGPSAGDYASVLDTNGKATLPVVLDVGVYAITANYQGNDSYNTSSGSLVGGQTVVKANANVGVVSDHSPASVFGQLVTFTATVSAATGSGTPTGFVDFFVNGVLMRDDAPVIGGVATFSTNSINAAVSSYIIRADYSGSANFNTSTGILNGGQTVNKANVSGTITPSANPAVIGDNVNFMVNLTGAFPGGGIPADGIADLIIDGAEVSSNQTVSGGVVNFSVMNAGILFLGNHNVFVHYDGNANFNAGDVGAYTQSIRANSATSVVSSGSPTVFGQTATFTATVTSAAGTPTGSVTFVDSTTSTTLGTVNLNGSGQASLPTGALSVGGHTITATYNPTGDFNGSSGTTGHAVNQAGTTTDVVSATNASSFGQSVVFTATVTVNGPSIAPLSGGSVTFFDVTTNNSLGNFGVDANGRASATVNNFTLGNHTIMATYVPSANFLGSSDNVVQVVNPVATTTTVVSSSTLNTSVRDQNVTFTATVQPMFGSALPTGTVTFVVDGVPLAGGAVALVGGQASFSTSTLGIGTHTVTATYLSNSANFVGSAGALAPVQSVITNPLTFVGLPGNVKSGTLFTVIVQYRNGAAPDPNFNGPVSLQINSGPGGASISGVTTVNAVNGVATFSGLVIKKAGAFTLRTTANGLPPVISALFNVNANKLIVAITPAKLTLSQKFKITTTALDATGAKATNYTGAFRLVIVSQPAGATLSGPRNGTFKNGTGVLSNLSVNKAGKYKFRIIGPNGLVITTGQIEFKGRRSS